MFMRRSCGRSCGDGHGAACEPRSGRVRRSCRPRRPTAHAARARRPGRPRGPGSWRRRPWRVRVRPGSRRTTDLGRAPGRADPWPGLVQRRDNMTPEPRRIAVAGIERRTPDRLAATPGPVTQQRRLTEPGRRTHQHQPTRQRALQHAHQPRSRHETRRQTRQIKLRGEQRIPFGGSSTRRRCYRPLRHRDLPLSASSDPSQRRVYVERCPRLSCPRRSGSTRASIWVIFPLATVNAITENTRPVGAITAPAAPLTSAGLTNG
jgi:hypothetical protein